MAREFTISKFEGTINGAESKRFLVELARTGCVDSIMMDAIEDSWTLTAPKNIFKDDPNYGVKVRVYFTMKKRENEKRPRLQDNPSISKFLEKFPNIYFAE